MSGLGDSVGGALRGMPWRLLGGSRPRVLLIWLFVAGVYSNSFQAAFQFDDIGNIVENPAIKDLGYFGDFGLARRDLSPWIFGILKNRYVGALTFALDYEVHGLEVFGYHLVNVAIHGWNAAMVYGLVLLLFRTPLLAGVGNRQRTRDMAFFAALLFAVHPLQTQAVTYIVQRYASLVAAFYLAAILCYGAFRLGRGRRKWGWYALALLFSLAAVKTKENAFTLPMALLLFELSFFRTPKRNLLAGLLPFFMVVAIIPLSMKGKGVATVLLDEGIHSRSTYFWTQLVVLVKYLAMLIVPMGQNIDHDVALRASPFVVDVLLCGALLVALATAGVVSLKRAGKERPELRVVGFGILWFFLTISVESSIIPIPNVMFEHRVYLPSVGFFVAFCVGLFAWAEGGGRERNRFRFRLVVGFLGLAVLVLGAVAYGRNAVWRTPVTLWADAARKSPGKPRPHNNLANAYLDQGRLDEAIREFKVALSLDPGHESARIGLARAFGEKGMTTEAEALLGWSLRRAPDSVEARITLGNSLQKKGFWKEACGQYRLAVEAGPAHAGALYNLAVCRRELGAVGEALEDLKESVRLNGDFAPARLLLGELHAARGEVDRATMEYEAVLRLEPDNASAHLALGTLYGPRGQLDRALEHLEAAVRLDPGNFQVRNNLGTAYFMQGRLEDAIEQYRQGILLEPDNFEAHYNLYLIYTRKGEAEKAARHLQEARKIRSAALEADSSK